ncbi:T9SS type A sorting domain-containing protein [Chryseobacterium daecheongense]|uniref:T9SS type A sorting domain-containing protein n=1 Tax=Chryseobacterium daecheongense TaxID=192389 RepID=UPI001FD674D0|nr:T9SS type A sorting domain-containing protein [Chryseobacterium daecheongense]UOU97387.1 T9SS type A sorting domain-containing protein [Chryseobacterium daecheongense]
MRKLYLLTLSLLSVLSFAQQLISFESSEGYTAGNINGQQSWVTTSNGATPPAYIANQVITGELAVGGTNSLKITKESAYGSQSSPVMGAFYTPSAPLTYNNFTLSYDVRITDQSASSSDFVFRTVNTAGTGNIVTYINFSYNGKILIVNAGSTTLVDTTHTWAPNTWYRLKMVSTATDIKYYLNNTLIFTGQPYTQNNISRIDFVHDNYLGSAYIDRIAINNEAVLAVKDTKVEKATISLYPNPASDILNVRTDAKIKEISVVDLAGKNVNVRMNDNSIDVRHLPIGTYLISVETNEGTVTEKFIKK